MISAPIRQHWIDVNSRFEGGIDHMYPDIKGLVTTAMGCLIEPVDAALALNWVCRFGGPVSQDEIRAEWAMIHGNMRLAAQGAGAAREQTKCVLAPGQYKSLIWARLDAMPPILVQHHAFADFETWPDPAAFALLSMAWAMGPSFGHGWPKLSAACAAHDWRAASDACHMDDSNNAGLVPRNKLNRTLFYAAALGVDLESALKMP